MEEAEFESKLYGLISGQLTHEQRKKLVIASRFLYHQGDKNVFRTEDSPIVAKFRAWTKTNNGNSEFREE